MIDGAGGLAMVAVRTAQYAGMSIAAGAVAFEWSILRRAVDSARVRPVLSLLATRGGFWACMALLVLAPARLYLQARGFVNPGDAVWPMVQNVLSVRWGHVWMAHCALTAIGAIAFAAAHSGRVTPRAIAGFATIVLCATPALSGHATAVHDARATAIIADWIHVAGAGAWIGALVFLTQSARALASDARGGDVFASLVNAFHPVALTAAAMLLATGVLSVWLRIERLSSLPGTPYGTLLFAKLACVIGVGLFGRYHARHAAARARAAGTIVVMPSLRAELAIAMLVIATTGLLTGTAPPGE